MLLGRGITKYNHQIYGGAYTQMPSRDVEIIPCHTAVVDACNVSLRDDGVTLIQELEATIRRMMAAGKTRREAEKTVLSDENFVRACVTYYKHIITQKHQTMSTPDDRAMDKEAFSQMLNKIGLDIPEVNLLWDYAVTLGEDADVCASHISAAQAIDCIRTFMMMGGCGIWAF